MPGRRCPFCKQLFIPCRYRPDQIVCSAVECQRKRRAAYHRRKLREDVIYRAQCRDSQQQWRQRHPEYMSAYRRSHKRQAKTQPNQSRDLGLLLESVKNNLAVEVSTLSVKVFVVCNDRSVKNTLASAKLLVIQALPESSA